MAKVQDILMDGSGDMLFENGDFVVGESTAQNIEYLLVSNKGEWRQFPATGVGIRQFLNGPKNTSAMEWEIRAQLSGDGLEIKTFNIGPGGEVELDGEYK